MESARTIFEDVDNTTRVRPQEGGIVAFRGITEYGIPDNPKDVLSSWEEYQALYGGLIATSDFPLICKVALDGGAKLRVSRALNFTDVTDKTTYTAVKAGAKNIVGTGVNPPTLAVVQPKYPGAVVPEVRVKNPTNGRVTTHFNLEVWIKNKRAELYENLTIPGRPTIAQSDYLKGPIASSKLVYFAYGDLSAVAAGATLVPLKETITFTGGTNGNAVTVADYAGDSSQGTGLHSFDPYDDFYHVSVPEIADEDLHELGGVYASGRQDVEYWAHLDNALITPEALIASREDVNIDSQYISYFGGGAKVKDTQGNIEEISELGHVAAIHAHVDRRYKPWMSAAGIENGVVRTPTEGPVNNFGGTGLYNKLNQLAQRQVNMLIADTNRVYLSGNFSGKLEQSKASFRNVVKLIMYIKKALRPTLKKYLEMPPDFDTFRLLHAEAEPFLSRLSDERAFAKTSTDPGYLWQGDQDAATYDELAVNNAADLAEGKYKVLLFIKPLGSLIEIKIQITLTDEGVDYQISEN